MQFLTLGDDDPARDLPVRDTADAPHPLAPVAECDSENLWNRGPRFKGAKMALDPEIGRLQFTLPCRPPALPAWAVNR